METIERNSISRRAIVGGVVGGGLAVAASTPATAQRERRQSKPMNLRLTFMLMR